MKKLFSDRDRLYDLFSVVGFAYVLLIGFLIFARLDTDASLLNGFFHTDFSFAGLNSRIDSFFNNLFNFNPKGGSDQPVAGSVHYIEVGDHTFTSDDQTVRTLASGTIAYVAQELDKSYSVVVRYGDIDATYFDLSSVAVQAYDHLEIDEVIGEHHGQFRAYFRQGGQEKSYAELFVSD